MTLFRTPTERRLWITAAILQSAILLSLSLGDNVVRFLRGNNLLRVSVLIVLLGALAAVAVLLRRARAGWPTLVVGLVLVATYGLVLLRIERPEERLHLVQYGAITALVFAAVRARYLPRERLNLALIVAFFVGASLGWLDEGVQYLLPDRFYELRDALLNVIAAALASVSSWMLVRSLPSSDTS